VGEEALTRAQRAAIPAKEMGGIAALTLMDRHLKGRDWLVGDSVTLADICLFAYTHVAQDGGFDMIAFPAVQAWIGRVAALPAFVSIDAR
jgi:glutathione S-transferase